MSPDERLPGDMPVSPASFSDPQRPRVAEDVVATYVADAVRTIPGIGGLHTSALQKFSERVRDVQNRGIAVRVTAPGSIEVDVHIRVAWGVVIPELARAVREQVTRKVEQLLDLEVQRVTLFVDEIDPPPSG